MSGSIDSARKAPTEKRFVGYETEWKPFHKEAEDKTPKKFQAQPQGREP
jgi:hypothetical protein